MLQVKMPRMQCKLSPTMHERQWKLLEAIWFRGAYVPAGFITDLASIPVPLRIIFKHGGPKAYSAILHDFLYQRCTWKTRKEVDLLFLAAMEENGVGYIERTLIYRGVRAGGWLTWNKYRKEGI